MNRPACSIVLSILWAAVAAGALAAGAQAPQGPSTDQGPGTIAATKPPVVVMADSRDPYHGLAAEIAAQESARLVASLDEALAIRPSFLLWVVSPASLSDRTMTAFSTALGDAEPRVAAGLITGSTIDHARALYERAGQAGGDRAFAIIGEHVLSAQIVSADQERLQSRPLRSSAEALAVLAQADYVHFSGHGGNRYWRLSDTARLTAGDIPALPPVVVSAFSCQTARIWDPGSIALRIVDQGAAAYAGFYYSPIAGYHIGDYQGLPFRHTHPGFPIGAAVVAVNEGARAGYARVAFQILIGDPRISLRRSAPYRLVGDSTNGALRTLAAEDAPAGIVPVRVPEAASYAFAEVAGLGGHWRRQPFFDRRVQMAAIGADQFLLVEHPGGRLDLRLRKAPPLSWLAAAPLAAALDDHLIVLADRRHGGAIIALAAGLLAAAVNGWRLRRRKELRRLLLPALTIGAAAAILHGAYAFGRFAAVTVTAKPLAFNPIAPAGTLLLCASGALLFLGARTWRGKAAGVITATLPAWAGIGFTGAVAAVSNRLIASAAHLDMGIYAYQRTWWLLAAALLACVVFGSVFSVARHIVNRRLPDLHETDKAGTAP